MRIFLSILLICSLACDDAKEKHADKKNLSTAKMAFDKTKWRVKDDNDYPYRDKMLEDLMGHQKLKALKWNEIMDLLGEPDRIDSLYLFYQVSQKRIKFFPLHTKTMVIKLSKDSSVNWVKIHK